MYLFVETRVVLKRDGNVLFYYFIYSMKVLRCQLPRKNEFYPEDLDSYDSSSYFDPKNPSSPFHYGNHLCSVCGIKATSTCSKCNVYYCCRDHQVEAWKNGHKENCGKEQSLLQIYNNSSICNDIQFPLWEVDIYPEPEEDETAKQAEADELARIVKINSADDPDSIIFIY